MKDNNSWFNKLKDNETTDKIIKNSQQPSAEFLSIISDKTLENDHKTNLLMSLIMNFDDRTSNTILLDIMNKELIIDPNVLNELIKKSQVLLQDVLSDPESLFKNKTKSWLTYLMQSGINIDAFSSSSPNEAMRDKFNGIKHEVKEKITNVNKFFSILGETSISNTKKNENLIHLISDVNDETIISIFMEIDKRDLSLDSNVNKALMKRCVSIEDNDMGHTQSWFIKRMKALGYPVEETGFCWAIANVAERTFISDQNTDSNEGFLRFNNRLEKIRDIPLVVFQRIGRLIKEVEDYKHTTKIFAKIFKSADINEYEESNKIEKLEKNIKKICKESGLDYWDTVAFFDSISILQNSWEKNSYIAKELNISSLQSTLSLTMPSSLDKAPPKPIACFTSCYDEDDLIQYFTLLSTDLTGPFSLQLSNSSHAITVNYDPKTGLWCLIDANAFRKKSENHSGNLFESSVRHFEKTNLQALAKDVKESLFYEKIMWTTISTTQKHSNELAEQFAVLRNKQDTNVYFEPTSDSAFYHSNYRQDHSFLRFMQGTQNELALRDCFQTITLAIENVTLNKVMPQDVKNDLLEYYIDKCDSENAMSVLVDSIHNNITLDPHLRNKLLTKLEDDFSSSLITILLNKSIKLEANQYLLLLALIKGNITTLNPSILSDILNHIANNINLSQRDKRELLTAYINELEKTQSDIVFQHNPNLQVLLNHNINTTRDASASVGAMHIKNRLHDIKNTTPEDSSVKLKK